MADATTTPASVVTAMATVTRGYPMLVVVDGSTVACPAKVLAASVGWTPSYYAGNRVQVTLRNPLAPIVDGILTDGS